MKTFIESNTKLRRCLLTNKLTKLKIHNLFDLYLNLK